MFERHSRKICTAPLDKSPTSHQALAVVRVNFVRLGFDGEAGKRLEDKTSRSVFFFGENAKPDQQYETDA